MGEDSVQQGRGFQWVTAREGSREVEGAPRPGTVAALSHHLKRAQGTLPMVVTYSSGCSQQQGSGSWVGAKGEPRERRHRSYCLGGAAVPLHTKASSDSASQPCRGINHPMPQRPPGPFHPGASIQDKL